MPLTFINSANIYSTLPFRYSLRATEALRPSPLPASGVEGSIGVAATGDPTFSSILGPSRWIRTQGPRAKLISVLGGAFFWAQMGRQGTQSQGWKQALGWQLQATPLSPPSWRPSRVDKNTGSKSKAHIDALWNIFLGSSWETRDSNRT